MGMFGWIVPAFGDIIEWFLEAVSTVDWSLAGQEFVNFMNEFMAANGLTTTSLIPIAVLTVVGLFLLAVCLVLILIIFLFAFVHFVAFCAIILFLIFLQEYLLPAIALYKMAKSAGFPRPWFAFIPFLQTYLEYVLPKRDFKVFFVKTQPSQRYIVAIIAICASTLGFLYHPVFALIPILGWLAGLFSIVVLLGFHWRKMYDLMVTFSQKKVALPISVVSMFVPLVYTIALLIYMNREPAYGFGGYPKKAEKLEDFFADREEEEVYGEEE